MKLHSNWITGLTNKFFNIEAREYPQDVSREKLEILKSEGYIKVTWKMSPGTVDSKCVDLNGASWSIEDFLSQTSHDAPIYSKSHVGCHCSIIIEGENLDPIEINALN